MSNKTHIPSTTIDVTGGGVSIPAAFLDSQEEIAANMYGAQAQADGYGVECAIDYARVHGIDRAIRRGAEARGLQLDADETWGRARDFEHVYTTMLQKPDSPRGSDLLPLDTSVPAGAVKHVLGRLDFVGEAQIVGRGVSLSDLNYVDVTDSYQEYGTEHYAIGLKTNFFDAESENYAGHSKQQLKVQHARRAIGELYNKRALGFYNWEPGRAAGFLNYPDIQRSTLSIDWANDSATQIFETIYDWFRENYYASNSTMSPNVLAMSARVEGYLSSRYISQDSSITIMQRLQQRLPGVKFVVMHELEEGKITTPAEWAAVAPAGMDIMAKFSDSPMGVSRKVTRETTAAPPFDLDPFNTVVAMFKSSGGIVIPELGACGLAFVDRP